MLELLHFKINQSNTKYDDITYIEICSAMFSQLVLGLFIFEQRMYHSMELSLCILLLRSSLEMYFGK